MAPLLGDRYLWQGLRKSRPYREFLLTQGLHAQGLPVPRPLAACIQARGLYYRGDLITEELSEAQSLASALEKNSDIPWPEIGTTLARFHRAGLDHVDLNARNILLNARKRPYLIDFDRCRLRQHSSLWQQRNLSRLWRSIVKFSPRKPPIAGWQELLDHYRLELERADRG